MSNHVWEQHGSTRVLYVRYAGLTPAQGIACLDSVAAEIQRAAPGARLLSDYTGAVPSTEFMAKVKQMGKEVYEPRQTKIAVLGIDGLKGLLLKGYNKVSRASARPFASKDEAIAYLTAA
ncbi:MAG TPA: hypothetical protein VF661_07900 [Actinomycetales bacterium]|jgi:hypothetical protein